MKLRLIAAALLMAFANVSFAEDANVADSTVPSTMDTAQKEAEYDLRSLGVPVPSPSLENPGSTSRAATGTTPSKTQPLLASSTSGDFATNIYMAASVGRSSMDTGQSIGSVSIASSGPDTHGTGVKLQLGYQFNPHWAVEGGYIDLGKVTHNAKTAGPDVSVNFKTTGWNIAAVGISPLNADFSLFGKIGLFNGRTEASSPAAGFTGNGNSTATYVSYGIGLMYNVTNTLGIRAEYEHFNDYGNLLSAGVLAKF